ncbi:hypothetical protein [Paenibacillus sp. MBLB4367]|uniref:hypothetical protein n=1 Tax=Paenibacillus sp. MBLB4367 TaxID=3384767 RepID=UPI00390835C6
MTQDRNRNMKITGIGSASGGVFHSVNIMGEGRVQGDLLCDEFKCMGNCAVQGSLQAGRYRFQGEVSIDGDLQAAVLTGLGQILVKGNVRGDSIKMTGQLIVKGACEADKLQLNGAMDVSGLLNAEQLSINLFGPCQVKEIGGGRISVRRKKWMAVKEWFTPSGVTELKADTIEGDDIYLEHTQAAIVRGNNVTIGPGCEIELVEYRNSLQTRKSATLRQQCKV